MNDKKEPMPDEDTTPDEEGQFLIESHIKIFDPETEEVFVHQR